MADNLVIAAIQVLGVQNNVRCSTTVITLTLLLCKSRQIPEDSFLYISSGPESRDGSNWLVLIR